MEFMLNKLSLVLFSLVLIVSCKNDTANATRDDFNPLPSVSFTDNKSIKISISDCDFERGESSENKVYSSSIKNGEVKLLLGSSFSCDYKNGAFIKELENDSDTFRFEVFQKGNRLSNECKCYFYYEIIIDNRNTIPKHIFIGDEKFDIDVTHKIPRVELEEIENKIFKK